MRRRIVDSKASRLPEERGGLWSAVNETARTVAALRQLEMLIHGPDALLRDRALAALLHGGSFAHESFAGIRVPGHLGGDLAMIADWIKTAAGDPDATRLASHVDRLALRSAKIDALLRDFLRDIKQLVIVGAGLDTRAFNLTGAADVAVFEVDFPHVLAFKADRLGTLPLTVRERTAIGCDATTSRFPALLEQSSFEQTQPTVWLLEGVYVYLSGDQIETLNRSLRRQSAQGSRLIATFMGRNTRETFTQGMISRFDDAPCMLAQHGWNARQLHYADIAREYGRSYPPDHDVYLAYTEPLP